MDKTLQEMFENAKAASRELALIDDHRKSSLLNQLADAILEAKDAILKANALDLARMDRSNPLYDRLLLDEKRLAGIASDMRHVAALPSPLGKTLLERTLDNGLHLRRVSVPFGVIGIIYEARPNVSFDVFSLCFKSGNACVLKGGRDADDSNKAIVALIHDILLRQGFNPDVVQLLPATHEATGEMLNAVGYIDLCIPRGGKRLIEFVRDNARVPVIETGAGVVNTYFDADADLGIGRLIVNNAKTRRVSVCNALDCLIVHESRLKDLSELIAPLRKYAQSGEINSKVACDPKEILAKVRAAYADGPGRLFELDGVSVDRWDAEGWWCNVRCSNTEPLVRLNLEAKTPDLMAVKRDELLALIRG